MGCRGDCDQGRKPCPNIDACDSHDSRGCFVAIVGCLTAWLILGVILIAWLKG